MRESWDRIGNDLGNYQEQDKKFTDKGKQRNSGDPLCSSSWGVMCYPAGTAVLTHSMLEPEMLSLTIFR